MASFILHPTSTAQWHGLVSEAAKSVEVKLDDTLESYLVFLLMRYIKAQGLADSIVGLEYLHCHEESQQRRLEQLRDVGDKCLLFAGFFPERAEYRRVSVRYFVDLGQLSYGELANLSTQGWGGLYEHLSIHFVMLMDVLQSMRQWNSHNVPILSPLEAYDLWNDKGSHGAWRMLRTYLARK